MGIALERASAQAAAAALTKAEQAIQKILLGLEHDLICRVEHVEVDTRNFANCKVEIFTRNP